MQTVPANITKELRSLERKDIANWLRKGELLCQARDLVGTDAHFTKYVRTDVGMALRTAQRAMAAWRHFGDTPHVARFSIGAMQILAPSPEARAEAITAAASQKITQALARKIIAKYIPPTEKKAPTPGLQRIVTVDDITIIIKTQNTTYTQDDLAAALNTGARQLRPPVDQAFATPERPVHASFFSRKAS